MKVKKINWLLMVFHLVVGFGISAVLVLVGGRSLPYEMADLMVGMAVFGLILSALSLLILGALFYAVGKKQMADRLEAKGFRCTSRFDSYNAVVAIDANKGKIGLLMRLNPFSVQILEASGIRSAEVSDGKGITGGTSLVSFRFCLDGMKFKIPTFSSNRCYNMKSNEVIEGIEKAKKQVEYLLEAKRNSETVFDE